MADPFDFNEDGRPRGTRPRGRRNVLGFSCLGFGVLVVFAGFFTLVLFVNRAQRPPDLSARKIVNAHLSDPEATRQKYEGTVVDV